jgi:hypothetical protein
MIPFVSSLIFLAKLITQIRSKIEANGYTMDTQWIHNGYTMDTQYTVLFSLLISNVLLLIYLLIVFVNKSI